MLCLGNQNKADCYLLLTGTYHHQKEEKQKEVQVKVQIPVQIQIIGALQEKVIASS